jgi:hypothetical protein
MDKIGTIQRYLDAVLAVPGRPDEVSVYRGHADRDYHLVPHVFREPQYRESEHLLLSELIAAQPREFERDETTLERLVRMQHYDLPTRLLDISHNPLVALYFATSSKKRTVKAPPKSRYKTMQQEKDGQVIILHVINDLVKYFNSDTVACLTNVALLNPHHKQKLLGLTTSTTFNQELPTKRLVHFINAEKPGFLAEIDPDHLFNVYLVKPKQNNRRIVAQSGGFFAFGLREKIDEAGMSGIRVERLTIDGEKKQEIRTNLDRLGINEKSMFPELDRVAKYVKDTLQVGTPLRLRK